MLSFDGLRNDYAASCNRSKAQKIRPRALRKAMTWIVARRLQVSGTTQRRAEAAAFVPAGGNEITSFEFHRHETRNWRAPA